MSTIKVLVNEQSLRVTDGPKIASRGVNENVVEFVFDESWDGFGKTAMFYKEFHEENVYQSIIDSDGIASVPHEVTDTECKMCFGVVGTNGNIIYTTEVIKYNIVKGVPISGSESEPPSPTIYQQMLSLVGQVQSDVDSFESDTNDRLDVMSSQMDEFIAEHAGTYGETVLWDSDNASGETISGNTQTVTLAEDCSEYDYIDIHFGDYVRTNTGADFVGNTQKFFEPDYDNKQVQLLKWQFGPASNDPDGIHFKITYHSTSWSWSGNAIDDVEVFGTSHIGWPFDKIVGRKLVADAELVDARVGVDGTVYQTVGAAIRGQINGIGGEIVEIESDLGNKGNLDTTDKSNLVNALNETYGLFTTPTIEAVAQWLNEHPEVTTTVQDGSLTEVKLSNALKLKTIKDYVTPEMFGAVGDGVADDTQVFVDMFLYCATYGVNVIKGLSSANYVVSGLILPRINNLDIDFCGATITNKNSANDDSEYSFIKIEQNLLYLTDFTTTITKSSNVIPLSSNIVSNINVGNIVRVTAKDIVNLYNPSVYGIVIDVGEDYIVIDSPSAYTHSGEFKVAVYEPITGLKFANVKIIDRISNIYSVSLQHIVNAEIDGVKCIGNGGRIGILFIGINSTIKNCYAEKYTDSAHSRVAGYGISVSGVNVTVTKCYVKNCKHCLASGNREIYSCGIVYDSNTVVSNEQDPAIDMHGSTEGVIKNNIIVKESGYGMYIRTSHTKVINNYITFANPTQNDKPISIMENALTDIIISGNTVKSSMRNAIQFEALQGDCSEVVIENNRISRIAFGANVTFSDIIIKNNDMYIDGQIRVNSGVLTDSLFDGNRIDNTASLSGGVNNIQVTSSCRNLRIVNNKLINYGYGTSVPIREFGANIIANNYFHCPNADASYNSYIVRVDSSILSVIANNLYRYSNGIKIDS